MNRRLLSALPFAILAASLLFAQDAALPADPSFWVGATPDRVFSSLGAPQALYAARGPEAWQDDVVFVYERLELYWFRDRVWQVRADAAFGVRVGDSADTAVSLLGEPLQRHALGFIYQLPSRAWPLRLRLRFAEAGGVSDLFVYRADF